MMLPLLAVFMGCAPDYTKPVVAPAPAYVDPGVGARGPGLTVPLLAREGRFELPDDSRPGSAAVQTRWEVEVTQDGEHRFKGVLPFGIGNPRGYPPAGIFVTVDGTEVRYADRGGRRWSGTQRELVVQWPTNPDKVVVEWPDLEGRIGRYSLADSGLEPEQFTKWSVTQQGETRQGLLLPAPAVASWDLTVPAGAATFESWLAMDRTPLPNDTSDGAVAVLEVDVDGAITEVARQTVSGGRDRFRKFEASLAKWAGQSVTLRLRSEPGANPDHDYLFWGSPTIWSRSSEPVRRIVVIGIDTTRPDHFGFHGYDLPTSPELDAIAATSVVFDKAWTPAPRTRPSFRSATTGRNPLDAVGAKNIGEVFRDNGFATGGFVANVHLQPRFGFHQGFDRWVYDNGATADAQIDRALAFMHEHHDRDSYVFLHLLDPHIFYGAPGTWRNKFVTVDSDIPERANRWEIYRRMQNKSLSDTDKLYLEQLYDGEIAYTSYQLGRFFHELDKMGDKTLVVIHSDHGEEFWEHGGFEHNHTLYDDTTSALLMIRPGAGFEGGRRVDAPVNLADIAPTLFDYAGFEAESLPALDGRSLRPLVEGKPVDDTFERPLGIGHLRYGHERWGVVHEEHKYILHTGTAEEELYDLAADPGEHKNLASSTEDMAPFRRALADSHDMAVCPGYRVHVNLRPRGEPIAFSLPRAPVAVQLLDPERTVEAPANQAWGVPPTRTLEELGRIEWEPGSEAFTYHPGRNPRLGQIQIFFDADNVVPEAIRATREDEMLVFEARNDGHAWAGKGERMLLFKQVVLSPPPGEAERMRLLSALEGGGAAGEDLAMLSELGYLGDDHGHDDPDAPAPSAAGSDAPDDSTAAPAAQGVLRAQACRW